MSEKSRTGVVRDMLCDMAHTGTGGMGGISVVEAGPLKSGYVYRESAEDQNGVLVPGSPLSLLELQLARDFGFSHILRARAR